MSLDSNSNWEMSAEISDDGFDDALQELNSLNSCGLKEHFKICKSIYGPGKFNTLAETIQKNLKDFWDYEIDQLESRRRSVMKNIEKRGQEAVDLEKALGLPCKVNDIGTANEKIPLIELENQLLELLNSYEELKQTRLEEYADLHKQDVELCRVLGEESEIPPLTSSEISRGDRSPVTKVPTTDFMMKCKERILHLTKLREELEYQFEASKEELRNLLDDLEIMPFSKVERFVCARDANENDFPATKENLEKITLLAKQYSDQKRDMIAIAETLRKDISMLSAKMLKDSDHLDEFLLKNSGFTEPTLKELRAYLKGLKEERNKTLKQLILRHRNLLDEWWTKCCYSDAQKAEFHPYTVEFYSEDVLQFHEIELENLQHFYTENKRIFLLMEKHNELWNRLLHLEEQANDKNRLFSNRGGQLLQEEKERKTIQKKVPAIKEELTRLLTEFKIRTGSDFLYFGEPLLETLREMELTREKSKENQKLLRKIVNTENILLESRLGTQAVAGCKRKVVPQQPLHHSPTKVMRMGGTISSATSTTSLASSSGSNRYGQRVLQEKEICTPMSNLRTPRTPRATNKSKTTSRTPARKIPITSTPAISPENGSPSYESFQNSKELLSSTKDHSQRVLRSRNMNNVTITKTAKANMKTPVKTPTKIPFRIATGGKIPSVVPPISPKKTVKLTTPRSKLPLIF